MRTIEEIKSQFLSLKAPFVWSLKLAADEFENLRNFIDEHHTPDYYPMVMIYVAEWYKRSYDINSSINNELTWFDAESVWKDCGFRAYNQWYIAQSEGKNGCIQCISSAVLLPNLNVDILMTGFWSNCVVYTMEKN